MDDDTQDDYAQFEHDAAQAAAEEPAQVPGGEQESFSQMEHEALFDAGIAEATPPPDLDVPPPPDLDAQAFENDDTDDGDDGGDGGIGADGPRGT